MNIGQRIRQRRLELNLSVDEVAKRLGKNRTTIYRYEKNYIGNLSISILEPLAKILQTTPDYLMGWDDAPNINDILTSNIKKYSDSHVFNTYAGLSPSEIEEFESGERIPSPAEICKLAEALHVTIEELFSLPFPSYDRIKDLYFASHFEKIGYKRYYLTSNNDILIIAKQKSDTETEYYEIKQVDLTDMISSLDDYVSFGINKLIQNAEKKYLSKEHTHSDNKNSHLSEKNTSDSSN